MNILFKVSINIYIYYIYNIYYNRVYVDFEM